MCVSPYSLYTIYLVNYTNSISSQNVCSARDSDMNVGDDRDMFLGFADAGFLIMNFSCMLK